MGRQFLKHDKSSDAMVKISPFVLNRMPLVGLVPDSVMPIRYLQPLLLVPVFIAPLRLLAKHWPSHRPFESCRTYIAALIFSA